MPLGKNYNLGSSSDMRRFQRDLEKEIMGKTKQTIMGRKYDVTCPHCHSKVNVLPGKSRCPRCGNEIDLQLDIKF